MTISTNIITTIAGSSTGGSYSGDGGQATASVLNRPNAVALDTSGNVYIADTGNQVIRKVTVSTGIITTIAGNNTASFGGDGGPATNAYLCNPTGVAVDASGTYSVHRYIHLQYSLNISF